jgi:hypothetical protein
MAFNCHAEEASGLRVRQRRQLGAVPVFVRPFAQCAGF